MAESTLVERTQKAPNRHDNQHFKRGRPSRAALRLRRRKERERRRYREIDENYGSRNTFLVIYRLVIQPLPPARLPTSTPQNCWKGTPTEDRQADFEQNKQYANMTIAAIEEHREAYGRPQARA
jgi:hypothetical protein